VSIQKFSLAERTRKSVEDPVLYPGSSKTIASTNDLLGHYLVLQRIQLGRDDLEHKLVWQQPAPRYDALGLLAYFRPLCNMLSQQVPCRNGQYIVLLRQPARQSPLPSAGLSEHEHAQRPVRLMLVMGFPIGVEEVWDRFAGGGGIGYRPVEHSDIRIRRGGLANSTSNVSRLHG